MSRETRQYDGTCLLGLSKTTMKFTAVSVPDSNLHLHNACQKCSVLHLYTIYEMVRGGEKETSKGG
jgi:hypothetical protein